MTEMKYEVVITATAEVRDAEGNLISAEPIETRSIMTEAEVAAMIQGE